MPSKKDREIKLRDGSGEVMTMIPVGRYLVHNCGVELEIVGGVYLTQKAFEIGLVKFLKSDGFGFDDTMHILSIDRRGGMGFTEFSNQFMNKMRRRAGLPID